MVRLCAQGTEFLNLDKKAVPIWQGPQEMCLQGHQAQEMPNIPVDQGIGAQTTRVGCPVPLEMERTREHGPGVSLLGTCVMLGGSQVWD